MPTLKRPGRLVDDANPILSALLGGKARRIFFEADLEEFAVPERVVREVKGHLPGLALKLGRGRAILENAFDLLPLTRYPVRTYMDMMGQARRQIEGRDPDDVDVLALALHLSLALWSNDRDFEPTGIERFTTAQLLALLFGSAPSS